MADLLVVGSGLFGLTVAHKAALELGIKVEILDKRGHPGGNAFSYLDSDTQIEIHQYGSHLFHTNNERVWDFVNKFTSFNDYVHRVWSVADNQVFSMPINLQTLCQLYGKALNPMQAQSLVKQDSVVLGDILENVDSLEHKAIHSVGKKAYDILIRGYTKKQWNTDPRKLPADIIARLPVRYDFDNRYFSDKYQGLPKAGYFGLINRLLDHDNISLRLNVDYLKVRHDFEDIPTIYTGAIDAFFDYEFGRLNWRTLDFELERHFTEDYQGCAVMNYADEEIPFTRIHEFRHLHPERDVGNNQTVIAKEYSRFASPEDEPFYPIRTAADISRLEKYQTASKGLTKVFFGGRLGSYRYLDMHMAIASAMTLFDNRIKPLF